MSNPAALYGSLKSACERGTTTQLALDNAFAKKRIDQAEYDELTTILQAVLNPPPAAPAPETSGTSDGPSSSDVAADEPASETRDGQ